MKRAAVGTLVAAVLTGCGPARPVSPRLPTEAEWLAARQALEALRETEPTRPFGAVVRVVLREPHTGKTFSARGAIAVDPHRALRMVLVGPGGATALDVWATLDRWRFEVPAAGLLQRGGAEEATALPVGFFRWWFLAPLRGRLLASFREAGSKARFILRSHAATIDLVDAPGPFGHALFATRLAEGTRDRVAFRGRGLALAPGDHATYDEDEGGVHVDVTVESAADTPDPVAFIDPDVAPS